MHWNELTAVSQFSRLLQESENLQVVIFKHSTRCVTSTVALSRIERDWSDAGDMKFYYLDVITHRDLSRSIAETLGVAHESPQLLLVKNGRCIYHASHLLISLDAARKAVMKIA